MTSKTKDEIKAFFQTGDTPTQAQFIDLIDSFVDKSGPFGTIETQASAGTQGFAFCSAARGEVVGAAAARTFQGITAYTTAHAQSAALDLVATTAIATSGTSTIRLMSPVLTRNAIETFTQDVFPLMNYGGYKFDGTTNYLDTNALTGIADGKKGSLVIVVRFGAAASTNERIISATGAAFEVFRASAGNIRVLGKNAAAASIMDFTSTGTPCVDAGTYVIMISWDLATAGSGKMWINEVSHYDTETTFTNDTIDYTVTEWSVGANTTGGTKMTGDIYSIWFDSTTNINFNTESNRRKFSTIKNTPVWLGNSGEIPTGTSPILFLGYDDYTKWVINRGTSTTTFTENGTPAAVGTTLYGQYMPYVGTQKSVVTNKSGVALATGATDGFLYVPSCAGTPTGTPTTVTGAAPLVVDSTNNNLSFYSGGAWRHDASGGMTVIASGTLSTGSPTVVDITSIPQTYRSLVLYINGASNTVATRGLRIDVNCGNGFGGANSQNSKSITGTTVEISDGTNRLWIETTQTAAQVTNAYVEFPSYQSGPVKIYRGGASMAQSASSGDFNGTSFWGTLIDSTSGTVPETRGITGIRITWNNVATGVFDAGTYALYGVQ